MRRLLIPLVFGAACPVGMEAAWAQHGDTRSTRDGIYTAAQAARGAVVAQEECVECHLMTEEFTGVFLQSWNGAPLAALYGVISTTMPEDRPGALEPRAYADVLAYILSLNGLPPGRTELTARAATIDSIRIDWRP